MKRWIPNGITLLNLLCGALAVVSILYGQFLTAAWLFFAAGAFDFADGLVARLLGVSSEHGKELDSLADMVSFGLVPGVIYYVLLDLSMNPADATPASLTGAEINWPAVPGFLVTLFSALRLAKFNLDTRQSENFIGLATPSGTFYAVGLLVIYAANPYGWADYVLSPWLIYISILATSFLLISEMPMFSFKLKNAGWRGNEARWIFLMVGTSMLLVLRTAAMPFLIIAYVLINLVMSPKPTSK